MKTEGLDLTQLTERLRCTTDGLNTDEARSRIEKYGYNELEEEERRPWREFLHHFWGPIPWMIEAAAVLSAAVGDWTEFWIISALLVANGIVGFWEEFQAGNAIEALKKKLALKARVRRNGAWTAVPARTLVPGDLIHVQLGDIVPADGRLLPGRPVEVDQSALTGESLPVTRDAGDSVYSGSIIKQGEANALVYGTGKETYFGKTAKLVESAHTESHFQKAVLQIGDYLIVLGVALVALIFLVALFRGESVSETLKFALVLTVASIPVAMPTVLSVTMAVGARFLSLKQAIVTRLASVEELAGMDVLCSDKTGTLTQNQLTLGEPFTLNGYDSEAAILTAGLASRMESQDALDQAVLSALPDPGTLKHYRVIDFKPFDPVSKRTEATVQDSQGKTFRVSKGALQVIVALTPEPERIMRQVERAVNDFARRGYRSLGVARTDEQGRWGMLGVLPFFDPPREDSKATIATARAMGIQVKMVTGDQIAIGKEIAGRLGMGTHLLDASTFGETRHHEAAQMSDTIEKADGFAQVFPEHKYHIVESLQRKGHIVGMTGDGANDAPALKKADAGIAVSGATDAARAAAAIVLLTPGLSVIIDAIKESRKIFQRMNNYAVYRIAETIRVLLFMTLSILVFDFYPVTAVMIVLLALLNDGAILSIAYDRVRTSNQPRRWEMPAVLGLATALGITGVISSFGLFYLGEKVYGLDRTFIQTLVYLKLSVAGHLTVFVTRTRGPFWSVRPAGILLWAVVGTQVIATLFAVFGVFMEPIGWGWALSVWVYALGWFLIGDQVKLAACRIFSSCAEPGLLKAGSARMWERRHRHRPSSSR